MSNHKDLKILVVDDEESLLSVLSQVLNREGSASSTATNGSLDMTAAT